MTRQVYALNAATGRIEHHYRDEGPRDRESCMPHIAQRTATQNGIPVRIPIRARQHHRIGGDS